MLRALKSLFGGDATRRSSRSSSTRAAAQGRRAARAAPVARAQAHRRLPADAQSQRDGQLRGDELRVHEGYLAAPPSPRGDRRVRRGPVARRAARGAAADRRVRGRDAGAQRRAASERAPRTSRSRAKLDASGTRGYNAEHFGGALEAVPVRVSRRMKSRLGHYTGGDARPASRARSRSAGGTCGATDGRRPLHTLLHEMVHQWQDETGRADRPRARVPGEGARRRHRAGGARAPGGD